MAVDEREGRVRTEGKPGCPPPTRPRRPTGMRRLVATGSTLATSAHGARCPRPGRGFGVDFRRTRLNGWPNTPSTPTGKEFPADIEQLSRWFRYETAS